MKHIFIVNPIAGRKDRREDIQEKVQHIFENRPEDSYELLVTEYPGHAVQLVREKAEEGQPVRFYACGGDGTLNEVVNGAVGYENAAITSVPMGTGNDFVKTFGPGAALFKDFDALVDGEQLPFDVIDCNGNYSINICSVGLDARVGTEVHKYSSWPLVSGRAAYNISTVVNVIKGIHTPFKVEVDGENLDGRYTMLVCCNGRYYGGGFCPWPKADPCDGKLEFLLVKPVSRFTVAKIVGKFSNGEAEKYPHIITHITGKEMKIVADRVSPINVDGEQFDLKEFSFKLSDKKVNFFFPAQCKEYLFPRKDIWSKA